MFPARSSYAVEMSIKPLTAVVHRRFQHHQRNVMMVGADRVVRVHNHMADQMIGRRRGAEAGQRAVRIDARVELADPHRMSEIPAELITLI